jgi:DnaJ-class molecular chaperone
MNQKRIDEIIICPMCEGTGRITRNERDLHDRPYDTSRYKTCTKCYGDRVLHKTGIVNYERVSSNEKIR